MIIVICMLLGLSAGAVAEPVSATGLVVPHQQVDLAATTEGVVTGILVKEGEWVTEGQVLVQLDAERETLEMEYAKVVMEKRAADLVTAESLLQEKVVSKNQVEERRIEAKLAEAQYRLGQQKLRARSVRAPFGGLVVRLHKQRGESVRSLERVAELADLSRVQVTLFLEASRLLQVQTGQVAEVVIPLLRQEAFPGRVDVVDPVVDPASGLFRVKVLVENADRQIRTGTKANVVLREAASDASGR